MLWGSFNFILNDFSVVLFIRKHPIDIVYKRFQSLFLGHSLLFFVFLDIFRVSVVLLVPVPGQPRVLCHPQWPCLGTDRVTMGWEGSDSSPGLLHGRQVCYPWATPPPNYLEQSEGRKGIPTNFTIGLQENPRLDLLWLATVIRKGLGSTPADLRFFINVLVI